MRRHEERLITNFHKRDRKAYEDAIRAYGDPDLHIVNETYDDDRRLMINCNALYCKHKKDLSSFWELARKLHPETFMRWTRKRTA